MTWRGWEKFEPPTRTRASIAEAPVQRRRSKMGNLPAEVDGIRFDSQREAEIYQELLLRQKAGELTRLERQPRFDLHALTPGGDFIAITSYRADFRYVVVADKRTEIIDVKAPPSRTEAYRIRKAWAEAEYGIQIVEVE